jgi:hypothetical protein
MGICVNCAHKGTCTLVSYYHAQGEHIVKCGKRKPITNADRIRQMTDEQLAAYIGHASLCVTIQGEDGGAWCSQYGSCNECIRDWLRQEV